MCDVQPEILIASMVSTFKWIKCSMIYDVRQDSHLDEGAVAPPYKIFACGLIVPQIRQIICMRPERP